MMALSPFPYNVYRNIDVRLAICGIYSSSVQLTCAGVFNSQASPVFDSPDFANLHQQYSCSQVLILRYKLHTTCILHQVTIFRSTTCADPRPAKRVVSNSLSSLQLVALSGFPNTPSTRKLKLKIYLVLTSTQRRRHGSAVAYTFPWS